MKLQEATYLSLKYEELLRPHCDRIEVAGSIRRKKPEGIKDVEIVCIPKPYEIGLFSSGIAKVVEQWESVKGMLGPGCKYTQKILPEGIRLDLFFALPNNWGWILALRTGSHEFNFEWLRRLEECGYKAKDGQLWYKDDKQCTPVKEEIDLFDLVGCEFMPPQSRFKGMRLQAKPIKPEPGGKIILNYTRKNDET